MALNLLYINTEALSIFRITNHKYLSIPKSQDFFDLHRNLQD